jgi:hypothetical protein
MNNNLVSYSSSSSSDEDDVEYQPTAKKIKLPVPFEKLKSEIIRDNPNEHQGRRRQIEHVEGNWASHIFIDCSFLNENLGGFSDKVIEMFKQSSTSINKIESPHLSLSKTFILKFHWIENFTKVLAENIKFSSFDLQFSSKVVFLSNEDKSRFFACLLIADHCEPLVEDIINQINGSLREFELPSYYENLILHASFLWKLSEFTDEEKSYISSGIEEFMKDKLLNLFVESITFKTGNKIKIFNSL